MINLTFLKGISPSYSPSKTFGAATDSSGNTIITKTSDYDIGMSFDYSTTKLTPAHLDLSSELKKQAKHGSFQIQGTPIPNLARPCFRRKVNFTDELTRLLVIDLDKVKVPPSIADAWATTTPTDNIAAIRSLLQHLGLDHLAGCAMTYVFSSSQMTRKTISVHLYFFVSEPVSLLFLRKWAKVINAGLGYIAIDPMIYNPVQPVYIAPPTCVGFKDPIPTEYRIGFASDGHQFADVNQLKIEGLEINMKEADSTLPSNLTPQELFEKVADRADKNTSKIKKNWLDTLRAYAGRPERGINEPAYRAAAQLVKEQGSKTVQDALSDYVDSFHTELWSAVKNNGERGTLEDLATYNKDKIRNYIQTAIDKEFGIEADQLAELVRNALAITINTGKGSHLMQRPVLQAMYTLSVSYPAIWVDLRHDVSSKQKIVTLAKLEPQMKLAGRVSASTMQVDMSSTLGIAKAVLSKVTLLLDSKGDEYMKWDAPSKHGYGCVKMTSLHFTNHLVTFMTHTLGEIPDKQQTEAVTRMLFSALETGEGVAIQKNVKVGERVFLDSPADTVYVRIGDRNGVDTTVVISKSKMEFINTAKSGIYWTTTRLQGMSLPSDDAITAKFNGEPTFKDASIYLSTKLLKYVSCDQESIANLTALAVSTFVQEPVMYLGIFTGPASSGKSTGASRFKQMLDPAQDDSSMQFTSNLQTYQKDENATINQMLKHRVCVLDNVETLNSAQQIVFSTAATGSMYSRRVMYSEVIRESPLRNTMILSCLANPITRQDLMSRSLMINFNIPVTGMGITVSRAQELTDDLPYMRYCMFIVVRKYLMDRESLLQSGLALVVSSRDIMVGVVASRMGKGLVTNMNAFADEITAISARKKFSEVVEDQLLLMFIAYLDSLPGGRHTLTGTERYEGMKRWCAANMWAEATAGLMLSGVSVPQTLSVDLSRIPKSVNSLGRKLGSSESAMTVATGWKVKRSNKDGKRYVTYYKVADNLAEMINDLI